MVPKVSPVGKKTSSTGLSKPPPATHSRPVPFGRTRQIREASPNTVRILLTLGAMWRKHPLQLPLFFVTVVWVLVHVVRDMTTPLTLSF